MHIEEEESLLGQDKESTRSCIVRIYQNIRRSKKMPIAVMFIAAMLDLMLVTVAEPILPNIIKNLGSTKDMVNNATDNTTPNPLVVTDCLNISRISQPLEPGDGSVSALALGLLLGAKPLTQVILNQFIGAIVDRIGHTRPLLLGFIVTFLSTLGFAFAKTYAFLMATRCLQGFGSSLMSVSCLAMISSIYQDKDERGRAMGVAFSGFALGIIVGYPMGSFLYQFAGREAPFLCMAGIVALGAIIRFGIMPINLQPESEAFIPKKVPRPPCEESTGVFLDGYILIATGAYFWMMYGVGMVQGIGPLYMQDVVGAEQWQVGILFLIGAIVQTLAQYCVVLWTYRFGWWLSSMIGLFIAVLGIETFTVPVDFWFLLLPVSVFSAGIGLVFGSIPPIMGHLADIRVNSQYGGVFALSDTGSNLGFFLGSTLTGLLIEKFNYIISFSSMGIVIGLYSFMCILLRDVPAKSTSKMEEEKQALKDTIERQYSIPLSICDGNDQ